MKKIVFVLCAAVMVSCGRLERRAAELIAYIPDAACLERSQGYLTEDFYAVLDTLFYRLPSHEAMDHQWEHFFVASDGSRIESCESVQVARMDRTHAEATIRVRTEDDMEEHLLSMELVKGEWLLSDFDGHKSDCVRYIANNRKEEALREAIRTYLVQHIAPYYRQGDLCVPALMMVHETDTAVWGDFWVYWYAFRGDTLPIVSGGNHSGRMSIACEDGVPVVTAFEQTTDGAGNEASAKRIFGDYYDLYHAMHSNESVREAVRKEQLSEYIHHQSVCVGM